MRPSADKRLLHDLTAVGALIDADRASADERLASTVGRDRLHALQAELAAAAPCVRADTRRVLEGAVAMFSRLRQWQWSVLLAALACGATVSMMGVIDLIWQFRSVLSGLGAVVLVLSVFLKTRHHSVDEHWIGS
jgi:hypothetical protein